MPDEQPAFWRPSFTVNTSLAGTQDQARVFQLANGDFWIAWRDFTDPVGAATAGSDIFGQRFNALGERQGAVVRLNSYFTEGNENSAEFAVRGDKFFVAYERLNIPGNFTDIFIERHSADGTAEAFQVVALDPTGASGGIALADPFVAILSDTDGVVVWERRNGSSVEFVARFFNPSTMVLGNPFVLLTAPGGQLTDLTVLPSGAYELSWDEFNPGTQLDVGSYVFNQSGSLNNGPFKSTGPQSESERRVVVTSNGIVRVHTEETVNNGREITDGFSVFPGTVGNEHSPEVAATNNGFFVVGWVNSTAGRIQAQIRSFGGGERGDSIVVANVVPDSPMSMITLADGRILLAYDRGDVFAVILDTRRLPNPTVYTPDGRQVGTIGDDDMTADAAAVFVNGWSGNDTISDGPGNNHLFGDDGDDRIIINGVSAAESADGGAGSDTLEITSLSAVASIDLAVGIVGSGGVTQVVGNFENFASATPFNLVVFGTSGRNVITTGSGNDALYGFDGADDLRGGGGDDFLDGGPGADFLVGGPGDDVYLVDLSFDSVIENFSEGYDEVRTALSNYRLPADVEVLTYTGLAAATLRDNILDNVVTGGPLGDLIFLSGGNDTAFGGGGDDGFIFFSGMTALDSVDGGAGTFDQIGLQGNYAALTLGANATVGIEFIVLLPADDTRFGGAANTTFSYNITTVDANVIAGQLFTFQANTLRVGENFTLNGSAETNGSFFTFGGFGIENLTGGAQVDGFYFGSGRWGASDQLNGGGGSDQFGLQGNYSGANAVTLGANQLTSIEFIVLLSATDTRFNNPGSSFGYTLTMNDGNVAAGQQMTISANTLVAGEVLTFDGSAESNGTFQLFSGAGDDIIIGGQLGDDLGGNPGADRIEGRGGADTLRGGLGADRFVYRDLADSLAATRDTIVDFATGDLIDLSSLDANSQVGGQQGFALIANGATFSAAGQLRVTQTGGNALVEGDSDGNGIADFAIQVTVADGHALTLADFAGVTPQQADIPFEPQAWGMLVRPTIEPYLGSSFDLLV